MKLTYGIAMAIKRLILIIGMKYEVILLQVRNERKGTKYILNIWICEKIVV